MYNRQPISTFLGIAAAVVLSTNSHAADINVPGDQPTIQAGINAANPGDVVIVAQERLDLFMQVCEAVGRSSRGVFHPSHFFHVDK